VWVICSRRAPATRSDSRSDVVQFLPLIRKLSLDLHQEYDERTLVVFNPRHCRDTSNKGVLEILEANLQAVNPKIELPCLLELGLRLLFAIVKRAAERSAHRPPVVAISGFVLCCL